MCLLMHKPANVTFTDEQLADMYKRNKDGYGIMYAKNECLHINKGIGTVAQWIRFFREYEHLESCIHLRMRTHGDIDLENCHPYDVFGFDEAAHVPMALMHNGVLSQGNVKDQSKSDTWHYIRDVIRPLLTKDPEFAFTPLFEDLIASHIGYSNKLALMDNLGHVQIVNKEKGKEWGGVWFSNTYTWSSSDNDLYPGINPPRFHKGNKTFEYDVPEWNGYNYFGFDYDSPVKKPVQTDFLPKSEVTPIGKYVATMKDKVKSNSFNADVDYIRCVLHDDFPEASKAITVPMIETLIMGVGCTSVEDILTDVQLTSKSTAWLVNIFRSQKLARNYLAKRKIVA